MADIFGVRATADLEILDTLIIICNNPGAQTHPAVVFDGQNYVVVYLEGVIDSRSGSVKVQRISPHGIVMDNGINIGVGDDQPDIAFDGNRCLVVWPQEYVGLQGRFINGSGQPEGPVIDISTTQAISTLPTLDFGSQYYLVVWSDFCDAGTDLDVYGQLISPTGNLVGIRIGIADGIQSQHSPYAIWANGRYLVVWTEGANTIYGRFITAQGAPQGLPFPISDITPYERQHPAVTAGSQNYLVVWNEFHDDFDLYGNLDTNVGIEECHFSTPRITTQVGKYVRQGSRMYDINGRVVSKINVGPGVYFIEGEDKTISKIVVVR
ncbi:MAG: hypothetical protein JSW49_01485 [candidate division WOR-3 bacterium]|nr:MAG: hypothetical protein JSW49_01485 [candidate division WOR-3 bacterium]